MEKEAQKQWDNRQREEAMRDETTPSAKDGVAEKVDTGGGEEVGRRGGNISIALQVQAGAYDQHLFDMEAIFEEAIVDIVKDHGELYGRTNKHFKDEARKECVWEMFSNSCKLSVMVCKTWFHYGKLTESKSGQAPNEITEGQNWIQDKLTS